MAIELPGSGTRKALPMESVLGCHSEQWVNESALVQETQLALCWALLLM